MFDFKHFTNVPYLQYKVEPVWHSWSFGISITLHTSSSFEQITGSYLLHIRTAPCKEEPIRPGISLIIDLYPSCFTVT